MNKLRTILVGVAVVAPQPRGLITDEERRDSSKKEPRT